MTRSVRAGIITYMVQDLLDGLSSGNKFVFEDFEKEVLSVLRKVNL